MNSCDTNSVGTRCKPAACFATTLLVIFASVAGASDKVCGVYTNIVEFAGQKSIDEAIASNSPFLMEKHKRSMSVSHASENLRQVRNAGFNTLFMTIYPLWGKDWWEIPAARNLVKDAIVQAKPLRVHLGLSLFNANFCADPSRYPGASRTIQCDGTRPSWVCFLDDGLWKTYERNVVEMAKLAVDGIFLDPEAYGPECYLCFCDNCVSKFNAWSGEKMPGGLVKPDGWLYEHHLWEKYTRDWHDREVRRHANALRDAARAVNPKLQLSSLLWEYPVAVGANDARAGFYKNLAIGLGTKEMPAWTLPEHTYYSDASDLHRIIEEMHVDLRAMHADDVVKVLPGIRLLRRPASSLADRGKVIAEDDVPGYWLYELADLEGKAPIEFEGAFVDPAEDYWKALVQMNKFIQGRVEKR